MRGEGFEAFDWAHEVVGDQRLVQFRHAGVAVHGASVSVTGDEAGAVAAVVVMGCKVELDVVVDVADHGGYRAAQVSGVDQYVV